MVVSDGGRSMCCLWWSVPSVLGVGRMCCLWPVDWLPWSVPLDTLPACEPVPWSLCGWSACCRWDVLPVVSSLDTLPAVRVWDVWPWLSVPSVLGFGRMCCLWDWLLWPVPSTLCQPVSLYRGLCVDGLPVAAGMCCLCSWIGCRWDGVPVLVFILPQ